MFQLRLPGLGILPVLLAVILAIFPAGRGHAQGGDVPPPIPPPPAAGESLAIGNAREVLVRARAAFRKAEEDLAAFEKATDVQKLQVDVEGLVKADATNSSPQSKADLEKARTLLKDAQNKLDGFTKAVESTGRDAKAAEDTFKALEDAEKNRLNPRNAKIYSDSLALLTMLLVFAVILEFALEVIFKWRGFLTYFSVRGWKAPIMILFSWGFVHLFSVDVVANLVAAYKSDDFLFPVRPDSNWLSKLVTALTLAGGSAGINDLMVRLGLRPKTEVRAKPTLQEGQAWLSVTVKRGDFEGHIQVDAHDIGQATSTTPRLVGTMREKLPSLMEIMGRNKDRFPASGGYTLKTGRLYEIVVIWHPPGVDPQGKCKEAKRVVGTYAFGERAIVDLEVDLTDIKSSQGGGGGTEA